jgi:6-phosphofructokinase
VISKYLGSYIIDKSFGLDTAVEDAQRAIDSAHVEACSAEKGIGLVKLMGRYSGYFSNRFPTYCFYLFAL